MPAAGTRRERRCVPAAGMNAVIHQLVSRVIRDLVLQTAGKQLLIIYFDFCDPLWNFIARLAAGYCVCLVLARTRMQAVTFALSVSAVQLAIE